MLIRSPVILHIKVGQDRPVSEVFTFVNGLSQANLCLRAFRHDKF